MNWFGKHTARETRPFLYILSTLGDQSHHGLLASLVVFIQVFQAE
jgi:hypothetical protein